MIKVIGYGSLMNEESLSRTISPRKFDKVYVKGYKRIFNLRPSRIGLYKDIDSIHCAVLNVEQDCENGFNAISFEVNEEEYEKLKIRERYFYSKEIEVYNKKDGEKIGKAILFIGNKMMGGERIVDDTFLPIFDYLERCRSAAYVISDEFGKEFDKTTFVGDGRDLVQFLDDLNEN